MNGFDIALLAIVLIAGIVGFFRGFIYQFATLAALALAFFLSPYTAMPVVKLAAGNDLISDVYVYYMARIVTGSVLYFLFSIFVWYLDQRTRDSGVKSRALNRFIGFGLGAVKGGAIVVAVLLGLQLVPSARLDKVLPILSGSKMVNYFRDAKPIPYDVIEKNLTTILQWMQDPKQSDKLVAKLKERGVEAKSRLKDLKEKRWLSAWRDPKFFALLKDPGLFKDAEQTTVDKEDANGE